MPKRPPEGIDIDPHYSNNASRWCPTNGASVCTGEAEVEGKV